jgi:hypothetical protein
VCNVGTGCDVRLWDVLHVIVHSIHIVYVTRGVAVAILGEVAGFSTIEAWSFEVRMSVVLLCWGAHCITIHVISRLCSDGIGVCIVVLILVSVVGCSGMG